MIETWMPVTNFLGYYDVSDRGHVLSLRRSKLLATPPDGAGYPQVNFHINGQQTHATVHVVELTAFAGPCPLGQEARHLNDIKTDNRWPENICWGPPQLNQGLDRVLNGTSNRGERHGLHKLTEAEVLEIRERAEHGEGSAELALAYGRSRQCIRHIVTRRRWGWL